MLTLAGRGSDVACPTRRQAAPPLLPRCRRSAPSSSNALAPAHLVRSAADRPARQTSPSTTRPEAVARRPRLFAAPAPYPAPVSSTTSAPWKTLSHHVPLGNSTLRTPARHR